jgi:hypothetical protein
MSNAAPKPAVDATADDAPPPPPKIPFSHVFKEKSRRYAKWFFI